MSNLRFTAVHSDGQNIFDFMIYLNANYKNYNLIQIEYVGEAGHMAYLQIKD